MQVSNLEPGNGKTDFQGDLKKIQAKAKLAKLGSIPFSELGKLKAIILNCEQSGQLLSLIAICKLDTIKDHDTIKILEFVRYLGRVD